MIKTGLFLLFLFECLYSVFQLNFVKELKYESFELTKSYRQHIYQTVYDHFWSKSLDINNKNLFNVDKTNKKIKFNEPSYRLRPNDNIFSWNILMNLPTINEFSGTQFSGLYDMLLAIDEINDDTTTHLKLWIDQIIQSVSFNEVYPILLYVWFILDIEIPAAPYNFIIKQKNKKQSMSLMTKKNNNKSQQNKKQNVPQNNNNNNNKLSPKNNKNDNKQKQNQNQQNKQKQTQNNNNNKNKNKSN